MIQAVIFEYDHEPTAEEVGQDIMKIIAPGWRFAATTSNHGFGWKTTIVLNPETENVEPHWKLEAT